MSFSRDGTGRLRAIWRILSFVLLFFAMIVAFELMLRTLDLVVSVTPETRNIFEGITYSLSAVLATAVMLRFVERRDFSMVLLDRASSRGRSLALGAAVGALTIGVPSLLLYATGWMRLTASARGNALQAVIVTTLFLLPAAFTEELLDRGYPFAVIREAAGPLAAIILTSLVFGLLHAPNPGANAQSIAVVTLSGVFLGLLLLATRSLYAVWMSHFAWNWVMAALLHTPVSGLSLPMPGYRLADAGPDWATGGPWGPEAGIPAAAAMFLVIAFLIRGRRGDALLFPVSRGQMSAVNLTEPPDG